VFFGGYNDTRECSKCTCDPPIGSYCTAALSVFKDGTCTSLVYPSYSIATRDEPFCINLAAGVALGSKSMTKPTYTPGSCEPHGGAPTGAATETEPVTFCCLPS
jgi:hypothetical protein